MRYLSVCAGIEAATVAWHDLGWQAAAYSEIEKFPCEVLKHHYPNVMNVGDMTKFEEWQIGSIDLLVGGTPCQSFSVAGLRKGLDDPRGNLMLTYGAIAKRFRPKWLVWENVPGVLSSNGGRDFGTFLGMLGELGYGFAYRVLDAQYFGVAQRRRRVFVVGCLGDWRSAAAVLFERNSLCGNPAPSRKTGKNITDGVGKCLTARGAGGGNCDPETANMIPVGVPEVMSTLLSSTAGVSRTGNSATEHETYIPVAFGIGEQSDVGHCLRSQASKADKHESTTYVAQPIPIDLRNANRDPEKHDEMNRQGVGIGEEGDPSHTLTSACVHGIAHPITFSSVQSAQDINPRSTVSQTLEAKNPMAVAQPIGFDSYNNDVTGDVSKTIDTGQDYHHVPNLLQNMAVRRLTPVECERLQGFPDGYTNIPWRKAAESPDGPRYKALGNSMAVPVMRWIGQRIQFVEGL